MTETTAAEASHGKEPLPIKSADLPQETSNGTSNEAMEPPQHVEASQDKPPPPSSSQQGPPSLQTHLSSYPWLRVFFLPISFVCCDLKFVLLVFVMLQDCFPVPSKLLF
jgi:hypothetical protein